jgi:hypothetical protein
MLVNWRGGLRDWRKGFKEVRLVGGGLGAYQVRIKKETKRLVKKEGKEENL